VEIKNENKGIESKKDFDFKREVIAKMRLIFTL